MALQWIDNFQQYGTTTANMLNGVYAEAAGGSQLVLVTDPDPTATGSVVFRTQGAQALFTPFISAYIRKVLPTAVATVGGSWRWWPAALPLNSACIPQVLFSDASNVPQVSFLLTPVGSIKVFRGNTQTGTLLGESTSSVVANAWQHIEYKIVISDTVGSVEIRVDGNVAINITGLDTKATANTTVATISYGSAKTDGISTPTVYWKDIVIWDSTGSYNNTFIGTAFVVSLRPDGDVSGTWTIVGGAGSGWASINETNPDDDTKYIYSPFPAATADVFTMTDLPADATSVKGIMSLVRSRKSDGGDGNLQVSVVSGASTGAGTDRPITTAYTYWSDIFETDPATAVQWTVAAVNAIKMKLNRTL